MKPNAENYNKNGLRAYDGYNFEKAVLEYSKAIEIDSENAKYYNNRASAYHCIGEVDKALSDYNKAIELDESNADFYSSRGDFYYLNCQKDKAMEDYNKAIELDDKNRAAYCGRAAVYGDDFDCDKAIENYSMAIVAAPYDPRAYMRRANIYNYTYDKESAINDYSSVITLQKKTGNSEIPCSDEVCYMIYQDAKIAYKERGKIYYAAGENISAIKDYTGAIELGDDSENIYCLRGKAYLSAGYYDKAIEDLNYAIKSDSHYTNLNHGESPLTDQLYNDRGDIYYEMGEYDKAITDYSKAISLNRNKDEICRACYSRGKSYMEQGRTANEYARFKSACSDFTKAAELKEDFADAYEALAVCCKLMADCEFDGQRKIGSSEKLTNYKNMLKAYENITKKCVIHDEQINNGRHRSYYDELVENAKRIISDAEASAPVPVREAADISLLADRKAPASATALKAASPSEAPECLRLSL